MEGEDGGWEFVTRFFGVPDVATPSRAILGLVTSRVEILKLSDCDQDAEERVSGVISHASKRS